MIWKSYNPNLKADEKFGKQFLHSARLEYLAHALYVDLSLPTYQYRSLLHNRQGI